jgi:hypothetical protein
VTMQAGRSVGIMDRKLVRNDQQFCGTRVH